MPTAPMTLMIEPGELVELQERATEADALAVIVENYGVCNSNRDQLLLLQKWIEGL